MRSEDPSPVRGSLSAAPPPVIAGAIRTAEATASARAPARARIGASIPPAGPDMRRGIRAVNLELPSRARGGRGAVGRERAARETVDGACAARGSGRRTWRTWRTWRAGRAGRRRCGARSRASRGRRRRPWPGPHARAVGGATGLGGAPGNGGCGRHVVLSASLRAIRRCADFARGFAAISPAVGATARRVRSSASGVCPQTQIGKSGGQTQPVLRAVRKRLRGGPRANGRRSRRAARRGEQVPRQRQRGVELAELVVDGDPQCLERAAAGCPPANCAGTGTADLIASTRSWVEVSGSRAPRADDRPGDLRGVALLAVLAQEPGEPALVPVADDRTRGQLLVGIHPHVERSVVRVGEAALTTCRPASRTSRGRGRSGRRAMPSAPAASGRRRSRRGGSASHSGPRPASST